MNFKLHPAAHSSLTTAPRLLLLVLLAVGSLCTSVTYPPANNYNYPTTTLLDVSNQNDQSFQVAVDFDLRFRGATYRKFWVNSNSIIYFGDQGYRTYAEVMNSGNPRLEVNAQGLTATRIIVRSTSQNVTVQYTGQQNYFVFTYSMSWLVTFYKGNDELFDIDMVRNDANDGYSRICSDVSCENINTRPVRLARYSSVLSSGQIAGIVVGSVVLVALVVIISVYMCRRKMNMEGEAAAAGAEMDPRRYNRPQQIPSMMILPMDFPGRLQRQIGLPQVPPAMPEPRRNNNDNNRQQQQQPRRDVQPQEEHHQYNPANRVSVSEMCSICLDPNPEVSTWCKHLFHRDCLLRWQQKNSKCPNCNQQANEFYSRCQKCKLFTVPQNLEIPVNRKALCQNCRANI